MGDLNSYVIKNLPDNDPPFANFVVLPGNTVEQNSVVTFDASPSTDNCLALFPLEYNWDFESLDNWTGFSANNQVVTHSFSSIGQKVVKLQVRDGAGLIGNFSKIVNVVEQPTPPIIGEVISVNAGSELMSVILNANVVSFGNTFSSLQEYGFVYSFANEMPTVNDKKWTMYAPLNAPPVTFDTIVTGLQAKKYWIRAYAKNSGFPPVYSDPVSFEPQLVDFVQIGGGGQFSAQRGDQNSQFPNEKPQTIVLLNSFNISKTEVTNEQYAAFLNSDDVNLDPTTAQNLEYVNPNDPAFKMDYNFGKWVVDPGFEKKPVVMVSWKGAKAFCEWMGGRLPTEAEWEAAARAGAAGIYPQWAGSSTSPNEVAVWNNPPGGMSDVAKKDANAFGLFDMSGNVAEWCADWYATPYSVSTSTNPTGPPTGTERVVRGGDFSESSQFKITVSYRGKYWPIAFSPKIGFRVVRN